MDDVRPADVDSLSADRRVIRNHRKLEGIVENAGRLLELDRAPGGFAGYLGSHPDFAATVADLKRNFKFLGDTSAYFFLAAVGEPVPSPEECGPRLTAPCPGCAGAIPPSSGYETRDGIGWGPVVVVAQRANAASHEPPLVTGRSAVGFWRAAEVKIRRVGGCCGRVAPAQLKQ